MSSTSIDSTVSALLFKRVAITSELVRTNVFVHFGLIATKNSRTVPDLDVDREVFSFVTIPARVDSAKELANVVPVSHNVDSADIERRMRDI